MMTRITSIIIGLALFFLSFCVNSIGQANTEEDISIVVPSQSISRFLSKLLPYKINMGENFSGSLWVKSIKNLKIEENKISFSSHLYGKNIKYTTKIGKQVSSIEVGNVNLFNKWENALRFDADKNTLYIKPHLKEQVGSKKESLKETTINTIFKVLSDIEYPIDLQEITPIETEFLGNSLTINIKVSDIYVDRDKLTIKLRPIPKKNDKN